MAELKDKIKIALDESRMLVLGTQVLLGFDFRAAFEPAFDRLPKSSQLLKVAGLMVLLSAIALIMAPGSRPRPPSFIISTVASRLGYNPTHETLGRG